MNLCVFACTCRSVAVSMSTKVGHCLNEGGHWPVNEKLSSGTAGELAPFCATLLRPNKELLVFILEKTLPRSLVHLVAFHRRVAVE